MYMHQFGWLSERGGNFLNLLQKEGWSNPGGNYDLQFEIVISSELLKQKL